MHWLLLKYLCLEYLSLTKTRAVPRPCLDSDVSGPRQGGPCRESDQGRGGVRDGYGGRNPQRVPQVRKPLCLSWVIYLALVVFSRSAFSLLRKSCSLLKSDSTSLAPASDELAVLLMFLQMSSRSFFLF